MSGVSGEPSQNQNEAWASYDAAQRHYETNHELHSSRMNLFLLVQTALLGFFVSGTGSFFDAHKRQVAWFGFALATAWVTVAISSWSWIMVWRQLAIDLATKVGNSDTRTIAPGFTFKTRSEILGHRTVSKRWQPAHAVGRWTVHAVAYRLRPTTIGLFLPVGFALAWLYLAAHVSAPRYFAERRLAQHE